MLAHALIEPDQRHGMDILAEQYLGYRPIPIQTLIGEKKNEQITMREVPLKPLADYAAEDADVTLRLREVFAPQLQSANRAPVFYEIESRLLPVLVDVEVAGVALDRGALSEVSADLGRSIETLAEQIEDLAGTAFNLNSPKQLGEVLFDRLHLLDNPKKTRTGQYKTDEQVLTALAGQHEIAQRILEYREASKLKSTYVDTLPDAVLPSTGRIHTTFSQLATATGRLASSHPNLQNIPIRSALGREIRKAFIPRDGDHVLLSADYSQIELRIMASLSNDEAMREAFDAGLDIHSATAARVHGVALEAVTAAMRRQAKMINYGLMYGMSVFGLAQRLGIARNDAGAIVDQYFAQFPGIRGYIDRTIAFARKQGYVETLSGRRRYLRDITSRNGTTRAAAERNAINTPIQGTGADMIKLAMIRIHGDLAARGLRTQMVLQVHDELLFDVAREELDTVTRIVREGMVTALPLDIPIEVDIGSGDNWLEAH
jgi:DNA polymerase-1